MLNIAILYNNIIYIHICIIYRNAYNHHAYYLQINIKLENKVL
jgi:hypothetical protein